MCNLTLKGMNWVVLKICIINTAELLSILIYVRDSSSGEFVDFGCMVVVFYVVCVSGECWCPGWACVTSDQGTQAESGAAESWGMLPLVTHRACNDSFLPQHWCYSEENTFLVLSCQNWPVASLYSAICRVLAPAWYDLAGGVITQNNWPHSTNSTFHTNN